MITKLSCCAALLLASVSSLAGEMLSLTFSEHGASRGKVYGTTSPQQAPAIFTQAGETVMMSQQSGRDYQLQGSAYGWARTQVHQVPRDATNLAVTPILEGQRVILKVEYSRKEGDDVQDYAGTVSGALGEWIPLLQGMGSAGVATTATGKSWSAGSQSRGLSVKVELGDGSNPH